MSASILHYKILDPTNLRLGEIMPGKRSLVRTTVLDGINTRILARVLRSRAAMRRAIHISTRRRPLKRPGVEEVDNRDSSSSIRRASTYSKRMLFDDRPHLRL